VWRSTSLFFERNPATIEKSTTTVCGDIIYRASAGVIMRFERQLSLLEFYLSNVSKWPAVAGRGATPAVDPLLPIANVRCCAGNLKKEQQ
jgi:hypothetical protein